MAGSSPTSHRRREPAYSRRVTAWGAATYHELHRLSDEPDSGITMVEGIELHRRKAADPWWRSAVPELTRVTAMPRPYVDGWSFRTPVAEMPLYLRWLTRTFTQSGGTLTRMALGALPDQATFVHEMVHVWQAQRGVILPLAKLRAGDSDAAYRYDLDRQAFAEMNIEQQARVVEHDFVLQRQATLITGRPPPFPADRYAALRGWWFTP